MFSTADDILVVGSDSNGKDHDKTLCRVIQTYRKGSLKLKKHKCFFRYTSLPFFSEIIFKQSIKLDPRKLEALTNMPPPKLIL